MRPQSSPVSPSTYLMWAHVGAGNNSGGEAEEGGGANVPLPQASPHPLNPTSPVSSGPHHIPDWRWEASHRHYQQVRYAFFLSGKLSKIK